MNKKEIIKQCFSIINQVTCGQFVTLRGVDEIPDKVAVNNDIDIMVCGSHVIPYLEQEFKKLGFILHVDSHKYMYGAEPHYQFVNHQADVKFDLVTGLYYRSSNDKMLWIPVNSEVQKSMIINKVKVDNIWIYQSSPEDELVHIICHCIFDKRKTSSKYIKRIEHLLKIVDENKVKPLMKRALYSSWEHIYEVMKKNPSEMFEEYVSYVNY